MKKFIYFVLMVLSLNICSSLWVFGNEKIPKLGDTEEKWKSHYGNSLAYGRDALAYNRNTIFTRSWFVKKGTNSNQSYCIRYIELVWNKQSKVSLGQAQKQVFNFLPKDTKQISVSWHRSNKNVLCKSLSLRKIFYPSLAGTSACITPWGFGVGVFRIQYVVTSNYVSKVIISMGESYETSMENCS